MSQLTSSERLKVERLAFLGYFAATIIILFYFLRPFAVTLMVAAVLSVILRPLYCTILERFPRPRILSTVFTLGTVLLILAPLSWIAITAVSQLGAVAEHLRSAANSPDMLERVKPLVDSLLGGIGVTAQQLQAQALSGLEQGAGNIVRSLGRGARETLGATAAGLLNLFILLFALYTFLIQAETILNRFKRLSPLDDALEDDLIRIFRGFSYGIVLGGFLTAIIQGLVAGVGYAIFGIQGAFFWGVMTGLFSFVPFVGTALIWIPLAISLFVQDQIGAAGGLAVYSVVITGSVDNFIKPWLIGQNSSLHPLLLFLSIFGGLMTLGPAGLLIGPVIASFFLSLAAVYESEMVEEDAPVMPSPDPPPQPPGPVE